jgi:hypothetical protein
MEDPYDAVRYIAFRSLRSFENFENFDYDSVVRPHQRDPIVPHIMETFRANVGRPSFDPGMLLTPEGALRNAEISRLIQQRDPRPFYIYE